MNGAQALIRTLVDAGVDVCFTNPGTSEMHFVAALDDVPEMRAILGLFEGVVTGAADGYGRMADRPAATLLHLGPGSATASPTCTTPGGRACRSSTSSATTRRTTSSTTRRSSPTSTRSPRNVSGWVRRPTQTEDLAARRGRRGGGGDRARPARSRRSSSPPTCRGARARRRRRPCPSRRGATVADDVVERVAKVLRPASRACCCSAGAAAARPRLACRQPRSPRPPAPSCSPRRSRPRLERGAGVPASTGSVPAGVRRRAARGHAPPRPRRRQVAGRRSSPIPARRATSCPTAARCTCSPAPADDVVGALDHLADAVGGRRASRCWRRRAGPTARRARSPARPSPPRVGALLPEGAIVVDEAATVGHLGRRRDRRRARHDWLTLTGGAIGIGMPLAVGRRGRVPDRQVIGLQADGSAMYTLQALWTQAREELDVTTVIFNNRSYAILNLELQRVGATPGPEGARHARPLPARPRLRRRSRRAWASTRCAPRPPRSSPPPSSGRSPSPARTSSRPALSRLTRPG